MRNRLLAAALLALSTTSAALATDHAAIVAGLDDGAACRYLTNLCENAISTTGSLAACLAGGCTVRQLNRASDSWHLSLNDYAESVAVIRAKRGVLPKCLTDCDARLHTAVNNAK